jgi:hypothetical protein
MSNKDNSINYIELLMDNNAGIKNNSTSRYLNGNCRLGAKLYQLFRCKY